MKKIIVPDINHFESVSNFSKLVEFAETFNRGFSRYHDSRIIDFRETTVEDIEKCRVVYLDTKEHDCPEYVEWVIHLARIIHFTKAKPFEDVKLEKYGDQTLYYTPEFLVCTKCCNKNHYYVFDDVPYKICETYKWDEVDEEVATNILATALSPTTAVYQ